MDELDELVSRLLPDLRPETLSRVLEVTGALELGPGLAEQAARERVQGQKQLEALEAECAADQGDPDQLAAELERLEGHREALTPLLKRCLGHPRFLRLVQTGYGTPEYAIGFWRRDYHLDRQAAQEIEELCECTFAQVRQEVGEAMEASVVLQERINELTERRRQRQDREERCERARGRLERLEQVQLQAARWKLRRFLEAQSVEPPLP